ncbi:related to ubiE/COQ5 methyltransferase [Ustilago trichophora]|uniref:Related to ubiE/COQ5 methyltransferase n=1 Tax=Ustilago trichophora TaxID=86804 RepID=A0A5C3EM63_9BASI|nr:related to ubiE/COQ5 methyltransferase [Ustilago trichophora]
MSDTNDNSHKSLTYTQGYSEAVLRSHASRTASTCAAFLLPHLTPDAKILDVGCGPGTITISLASYVSQGSIVGVDYSHQVVAEAQKRLDSEEMLLHLPEPVKALKEMKRVCKIRGIVAVREADFSTSLIYPPTATFQLWLDTAISIYRSIGAEPDAGRRLIRWALDAGFSPGPDNVTYSSSNQAYGGQPGAQFWGEMWSQRIAAESWKQQALNTKKVTEQEVKRMQEDWLQWSKAEDGVFVMVCGEVLLRK